jgi:hypothetical protein
VIGATDATGEEPRERPVSPSDLIGSIYELLGIDPEAKLPHPQGLDARVLQAGANGLSVHRRLEEIM